MIADLERDKSAAKQKLNEAERKTATLQSEINELKTSPEIPEELKEKLSAEAEAKAKQNAEAAKQYLKDQLAASERERDELRKKLLSSDSFVTEFKTYFNELQQTFNKMNGALLKVKNNDPEMAEKLTAATRTLLEKLIAEVK